MGGPSLSFPAAHGFLEAEPPWPRLPAAFPLPRAHLPLPRFLQHQLWGLVSLAEALTASSLVFSCTVLSRAVIIKCFVSFCSLSLPPNWKSPEDPSLICSVHCGAPSAWLIGGAGQMSLEQLNAWVGGRRC